MIVIIIVIIIIVITIILIIIITIIAHYKCYVEQMPFPLLGKGNWIESIICHQINLKTLTVSS